MLAKDKAKENMRLANAIEREIGKSVEKGLSVLEATSLAGSVVEEFVMQGEA